MSIISDRSTDWFGAGHTSRQDADNFSKDTWKIDENFASPVPTRSTFLGYDARSEVKTGKAPDRVETFIDQKSLMPLKWHRNPTIAKIWPQRQRNEHLCLGGRKNLRKVGHKFSKLLRVFPNKGLSKQQIIPPPHLKHTQYIQPNFVRCMVNVMTNF